MALTYDIAHFEISVALNHDVDDLLVGIVAEIKESFAGESVSPDEKERTISVNYHLQLLICPKMGISFISYISRVPFNLKCDFYIMGRLKNQITHSQNYYI